ncbi:MAG: class I SAM-dependent methyltransferase [Desulfuromonadales bacterium]
MKYLIKNALELSGDGVWFSPNLPTVNYSDGVSAESYLQKIFEQVEDLSSGSIELESNIKDWPSQYHLSNLRSNLLKGFSFNGTERVLEVGSGCGAITRFLGETSAEVIAVEGSYERAKLTRLRTRGQDNVKVVCASYADLAFVADFDLVVCIGVLEYASMYVSGNDPYAAFLSYLKKPLVQNGSLVLAIENQFGLKYFSSAAEDHTGIMFDGIEGYPRKQVDVRTFGYGELNSMLSRQFSKVSFFFPYPDYKLPACVLSEDFLNTVNPGELVARSIMRDGRSTTEPLFNEALAIVEISKNGFLSNFSNSFLVIATDDQASSLEMDSLGVIFNNERKQKFRTSTHFYSEENGSIFSIKSLQQGGQCIEENGLRLSVTRDKWINGYSLYYFLLRSLYEKNDFSYFYELCSGWKSALKSVQKPNGKLPGLFFDANWSNFIIDQDDGKFIDLEWSVDHDLEIEFVIFKSAVNFLDELNNSRLKGLLRVGGYEENIFRILSSLKLEIDDNSLVKYCEILNKVSKTVFPGSGYDYLRISKGKFGFSARMSRLCRKYF